MVSGDFTIGGNAPNPFYPGTSERLDLAITNPFKFAIKVLTVSVTVEPVPAKNGVPDPACPAASNLLVTRPLGTTLDVPALSTNSLSDLGVPQAQWPVLTMTDLPTNQDACKGATFTLVYSGTATMGTANPVHTSTVLLSSPDPSAPGNAVALTAIVAKSSGPGTPNGSVSFYSGSPSGPHALLGTSSLNANVRATWSASELSAGTDSLYAVYTGDTNFTASTSPVISQLVISPPANCTGTFQNSVIANPASPTVNGTNESDFIYAFGGKYRVNGFNGNDCIWLGDGDNVVTDGNGNDVVLAGNGSNSIALGNGNDRVTLGTGPSNVVSLGAGVDTVTVLDSGNHDTINGGNGNETIYFGTGTYNTYRGASNHTSTCHVPVPPSSWHGTPAAYYDDTLIGCTVVAS
jgi:hypothetical protein